MEVGEEGDYMPVATRMTPAFTEMGRDESHFNVSLIVRDKVTRPCPQLNRNPFQGKGEPMRYRTEVLLTRLTPCR